MSNCIYYNIYTMLYTILYIQQYTILYPTLSYILYCILCYILYYIHYFTPYYILHYISYLYYMQTRVYTIGNRVILLYRGYWIVLYICIICMFIYFYVNYTKFRRTYIHTIPHIHIYYILLLSVRTTDAETRTSTGQRRRWGVHASDVTLRVCLAWFSCFRLSINNLTLFCLAMWVVRQPSW